MKNIFITVLFSALLCTLLAQSPAQNINNQQRTEVQTATSKADEIKPIQQQPSPQTVKPVEPETQKPQVKTAIVHSTNCGDYATLISKYDWDQDIALAMMRAESGCNPNATNWQNFDGSVDRGLFQVNSIHRDMVSDLDDLYDPATNISIAYRIYHGNGWRAWSAYNNGSYLRYL